MYVCVENKLNASRNQYQVSLYYVSNITVCDYVVLISNFKCNNLLRFVIEFPWHI